MPIEYLNLQNLDELIDLSEESYRKSSWSDCVFDKQTLTRNIKEMIGNKDCFVCLYRKGERIVGYFSATLGKFLFSEALFGMENGIYIKPEHRGGRIALLMYNEFVAWCRKMKAEPFVEIYFGDDNEKTYSFFRKVGMVECGRVFRGGKQWVA